MGVLNMGKENVQKAKSESEEGSFQRKEQASFFEQFGNDQGLDNNQEPLEESEASLNEDRPHLKYYYKIATNRKTKQPVYLKKVSYHHVSFKQKEKWDNINGVDLGYGPGWRIISKRTYELEQSTPWQYVDGRSAKTNRTSEKLQEEDTVWTESSSKKSEPFGYIKKETQRDFLISTSDLAIATFHYQVDYKTFRFIVSDEEGNIYFETNFIEGNFERGPLSASFQVCPGVKLYTTIIADDETVDSVFHQHYFTEMTVEHKVLGKEYSIMNEQETREEYSSDPDSIPSQ